MSPGTRAEPLFAVVAPEPAPWLAPLVADLQRQGPVALFCPWALPPGLSQRLARLAPPRLRAALLRRTPPSDHITVLPGWPLLVEAPVRLFIGDRAERRLGSRFALRAAVDHAAAHWLPAVQAVYAPSCAAERTFSAAQRRGARTHLIVDLPLLRRLHQDLDEAAAHHPGATFLRNYRAGHGALRRQEAELVLATRVLCRGPYARDGLRERGVRPTQIDLLAPSPAPSPDAPGGHSRTQPPRLLLAGLAAARAGVYETLEAVDLVRREHRYPSDLADLTLLVRTGDGAEPADLLRRPGVRAATSEERRQLQGVAAVLSPALAECYPDEVVCATACGVPVIATARGAAASPLTLVPPFDPAALARAIAAVLASPGER